MLDEREALARFRPVYHEAHADGPKEAFLPVLGTDDLHTSGCRFHSCSLSSDSSVAQNRNGGRRARQCVHGTGISDQTRPYRMTRRAELEEQTTRRRITESTVALHEELGSVRKLLPVWQEKPRHGLDQFGGVH
jgi:hypothetical protein